jgi:hypothetical protein
MRYLLKLVVVVITGLVTNSSSLFAQEAPQSTCNISYQDAKRIMNNEGKVTEIYGVSGERSIGGMMIIFTGADRSWGIIFVMYPTARACIIASGTKWTYDLGRDDVLGIIPVQTLPNPSGNVCRLTGPFTPPVMKMSRDSVVTSLKQRNGEVRIGFGIEENGTIVELFEDPGGLLGGDGSWTLLNTDLENRSCSIASGRFGLQRNLRYVP